MRLHVPVVLDDREDVVLHLAAPRVVPHCRLALRAGEDAAAARREGAQAGLADVRRTADVPRAPPVGLLARDRHLEREHGLVQLLHRRPEQRAQPGGGTEYSAQVNIQLNIHDYSAESQFPQLEGMFS